MGIFDDLLQGIASPGRGLRFIRGGIGDALLNTDRPTPQLAQQQFLSSRKQMIIDQFKPVEQATQAIMTGQELTPEQQQQAFQAIIGFAPTGQSGLAPYAKKGFVDPVVGAAGSLGLLSAFRRLNPRALVANRDFSQFTQKPALTELAILPRLRQILQQITPPRTQVIQNRLPGSQKFAQGFTRVLKK